MTDNTNLPSVADDRQIAESTTQFSSASIWASFQKMAKDPTMDAAKMQTMYELQKTMIEDQRQEEFNQAKFAAMAEMPTITKNRVVSTRSGEVMYRYSDFKHLYSAVKPILNSHGLILDFDVSETSNESKVPFLRVAPILRHRNGYVWNGSHMPVPITAANSSISLTQAAKGAVETGKRTVTISCLGITEDEDQSLYAQTDPQRSLPDSTDHKQILSDAEEAAGRGILPYRAFFESLTNVQKTWLVANGCTEDDLNYHERLKSLAAAND